MLIVSPSAYDCRSLSWKTLTGILVGVAVIIALANVLAWEYLKSYPVNRGISRVWQKWQLVERQKEKADWLIIGDSTCSQGIDPAVIEAETDQTALNLCTIANATAVNGVWQLERSIERVGAPKVVVMFHAYHVWERGTADLVAMFDQIPLERGFQNRLSPPLHLGFLSELEIATRPVRTLFLSNLSIEFVIERELAALWNWQTIPRSDALADMGYVERFKGFVGSNYADPEKVIAQSRASARAYATRDFVITPENEAALRAACAVATKNGFEIYLANSSISTMLYQDPGFQVFYGKMVDRLSSIVAECPAMRYVLKVPAQFEPGQMDNEDHVVTDELAARLTRQLVSEVEALR